MSDKQYCYPPDYKNLINKLDIREPDQFDRVERRLVALRITEGIPTGSFDLSHLKAIHFHLFQDIFDWAGQVRTVEISKGGHQFQFRQYIETGMADIHRRITAHNYLRGLSASDFSELAGEIVGDLNYVHPFREGNGRTQLLYLAQLAEHAGHIIDLTRITPESWMDASKASHKGDYDLMRDCIADAMGNRVHDRDDHGHER